MNVGKTPEAIRQAKWYQDNKAHVLARTRKRYQAKRVELLQNTRAWMAKNPDNVIATARRYRANHLELCRKRSRESNQKNKVKLAAYSKVYNKKVYTEQRETILAKNRAWAQRNKASRKAYNQAYRLKHAARLKSLNLAWRAANSEQLKEYRIKNRVISTEQTCRRRALKRGARINLSQITSWMKSIKSRKKASCYWCESVVPTATIHFDHIVALSKGGPHTIENLCVACGPCNLSKSSKPVRTWTKVNQTFLEL